MKTFSLRRRSARLTALAATITLFSPVPAVHAADVPITASATGSGLTTVDGELRSFSFTALEDESGNAIGMAVVNNRAIGEMFQLAVDCMNVFENMAIVSGVIIRHTDVHAIGLTGIFAVVDSGEESKAPPDLITQVFFFRPGVLTCADLGPTDAAPFLVPIESGNVQVK
jgi:hypothetical protein